jgi:hypothetical protein
VWLVCGWLLVVVACVVARLFDNEKSIPGKSPVRDCRFLADLRGRFPLGLYLLREGCPRLRSRVARGATTRWLLLGCSKLTSTLARAGLLSSIALGTGLAELASWVPWSLTASWVMVMGAEEVTPAAPLFASASANSLSSHPA